MGIRRPLRAYFNLTSLAPSLALVRSQFAQNVDDTGGRSGPCWSHGDGVTRSSSTMAEPANSIHLENAEGRQEELYPAERFWRQSYDWLAQNGYTLRRRYRPGWVPTYKKLGNPRKYDFEDSAVPSVSLLYCRRHRRVVLKGQAERVEDHGREFLTDGSCGCLETHSATFKVSDPGTRDKPNVSIRTLEIGSKKPLPSND